MEAPLEIPALGAAVPRLGGPVLKAFGRGVLRLMGWRFEGRFPDIPRCVLIEAPHTSNWDFVVGLAALFALGLRASWLGKHTIFRFPFGRLLQTLGGIPVDRRHAERVVAGIVTQFVERERMWLGIAPEGTRKRVPHWKSGFHRIARGARVPIVPVAFDYPRRVIRIFAPFTPTDDYLADSARLSALFGAEMARHPTKFALVPEGGAPDAG
jgi:1-acyl-sn-glycerol-3-phosphate acyltransferase